MKRILAVLLATILLAIGAVWGYFRLAPEDAADRLIALDQRLAGLEAKTLVIPGFTIHYLEGGQGEPLILVHGFGGDKNHFNRVARELTRHYRVIALDLPGFGASSAPTEARYGVREQTERLGQFMDVLGLPSAHFGGSSMGGWIAAAFAVLQPQRVESLWLLAPSGLITAEESEVRRAYRETGELLLVAERPEDFPHLAALVMSRPPYVPGPVRQRLAEQAAARAPHLKRIFATLVEEAFWLEPQMRGHAVPALVVWGEEDRVLHPSGAEVFGQLLPNASVQRLPGIGHLPMIEAPEVTAAAYLAFRQTLRANTP